MSSAVFAALTLACCLYVAAYKSGETRKLRHIPTIGNKGLLLSYWSALQFQFNGPNFLERGFSKLSPDVRFVKIPSFTRWLVVAVGPETVQEFTRAPDKLLSVPEAFEEFLQASYTLHQAEIGDKLQLPILKNTIPRSMDEIFPDLHEETQAVFEETFKPAEDKEWRSYVISPTIMHAIARISNRLFVGLPLCRVPDYVDLNIRFANEVVFMSYILLFVPSFIRPLVNRMISPIPGRFQQAKSFLQPAIGSRREEAKSQGRGHEKRSDYLTWLMDVAEAHNKADRDVILRMLSTNFASIHTTSVTFTQILFTLLTHPQYIEPLRTEIEQSVGDEGWTKVTLERMRLLESFMKECQRRHVVGSILLHRMVIEDCTIAGTFLPKGTMLTANLLHAHTLPAAWGESAGDFDPYRFLRIEEETGRKCSLVTTTPNILNFGHGRHACPGRFLAAQQMKLMLAYLLENFDMRLDNPGGKRPKDFWFGLACIPDPRSRILVRRRADRS